MPFFLALFICVGIACVGACKPTPDTPKPNTETPGRCGDGEVSGQETCDGTEGCRSNCTRCGDGVLDPDDEDCDSGDANGAASAGACPASCRSQCGNGVVEFGEDCDSGSASPDEGCVDCQEQSASWRAELVVGPQLGPLQVRLQTWKFTISSGFLGDAPSAGLTVDQQGSLYVADSLQSRLLKVTADGEVLVVAGARSVILPTDVLVDDSGTIFIAGAGRIAKSSPGGTFDTVIDAGASAIALDGAGGLYFSTGTMVQRISSDGTVTVVAGTGTGGFSGDNGPATEAQLAGAAGLAVDRQGNIFVADASNHRIRKISPEGIITTVAGSGASQTGCLRGLPGANLCVENGLRSFAGDNGPATSASLFSPQGVAVDEEGNLFIADTWNQRIRKVDSSGTITTIAGIGSQELSAETLSFCPFSPCPVFDLVGRGFSGDGGPALDGRLNFPSRVTIDGQGNVFFTDSLNQRVRRISAEGTLTTVLGGADTEATRATAEHLGSGLLGYGAQGLAVDEMGNVFFSEGGDLPRVRKVTPDGTLTTVAGNAPPVFERGSPANDTDLVDPGELAFGPDGSLFIADHDRVRKRSADGTITTIAGGGSLEGPARNGADATEVSLQGIIDLKADHQGNLYVVSDEQNPGNLLKIYPTGIVSIIYPDQQVYSVAIDSMGEVRVESDYSEMTFDSRDNLLRVVGNTIQRVTPDGTITTVAGIYTDGQTTGLIITLDGWQHFRNDGAPGFWSTLEDVRDIASGPDGSIFLSEIPGFSGEEPRIRRIGRDGIITTIAGFTGIAGIGPARATRMDRPVAFAASNVGQLFATGDFGVVLSLRDAEVARVVGRYPQRVSTGDNCAGYYGDGFCDEWCLNADTEDCGPDGLRANWESRTDAETVLPELAYYRSSSFGDVFGVAYDERTGTIFLSESARNAETCPDGACGILTPAIPDPPDWGDRIWAVATRGDHMDPNVPQTWTISPLVNVEGTRGYAEGDAATALLSDPRGLLLDDASRTLYIADAGNHAVRALDLTTMQVSTVVNGGNVPGFAGEAGPALDALLSAPTALARCPNGDFFIADTGNHRIRRIAGSALAGPGDTETSSAIVTAAQLASAAITTVLGNGNAGPAGVVSPSADFPIDSPSGVTCDLAGNVYTSSRRTIQMLAADPTGVVDGSGAVATLYDAQLADTEMLRLDCLSLVAVTSPVDPILSPTRADSHATELLTADACSGVVVRLTRGASP